MQDLLVRLYGLPPLDLRRAEAHGVTVRRALAPEKHLVVDWVRTTFEPAWASEVDVAFSAAPMGCFVAVRDGRPIGFACIDTTAKGFFGPIGVDASAQGTGVGTALFLTALHAMRAAGYGYAVIGAAGPTDFYGRIVPILPIPDSWPGIYAGLLRDEPDEGSEG